MGMMAIYAVRNRWPYILFHYDNSYSPVEPFMYTNESGRPPYLPTFISHRICLRFEGGAMAAARDYEIVMEGL